MPTKCEDKCSVNDNRYLYEYSVVQYVPSVERGETINIGLIMMCKSARWIKVSFHFDRSRLMSFCPTADIEGLKEQMIGFDRVATGNLREGGPIAGLEAHERFRWLTAVRSASLQTSRPHAGLTHDLEKTFKDLYASLVL